MKAGDQVWVKTAAGDDFGTVVADMGLADGERPLVGVRLDGESVGYYEAGSVRPWDIAMAEPAAAEGE